MGNNIHCSTVDYDKELEIKESFKDKLVIWIMVIYIIKSYVAFKNFEIYDGTGNFQLN